MADKDEEYHLPEDEEYHPDEPSAESTPLDADAYQAEPEVATSNLRRNIIILVAVVLGLGISYKLYEFYKNRSTKVAVITPIAAPQPVVQPQPVAPIPVEPSSQPQIAEINQKIATLEVGQQNMRDGLSALKTELATMNQNVDGIGSKINELNSVISNLSTRLLEEAQALEQINSRMTRPKIANAHVHKHKGLALHYYVQAIIPGRAWLINTKGKTLTVREGSRIPGVGVVKLIDAPQGRVVLNTGKVLRFSQTDS